MKNNICNNCNKSGHLFHNCKLPITSYGVILFTHINKELKYLMICRKDTFGYIDFIRGKYSPYNFEQIQNIVNEMSNSEKNRILNNTFDSLWKKLWGYQQNIQYKNEEIVSCKKFDLLTSNTLLLNQPSADDTENTHNPIVNLEYFIKNSTTNWPESEWEFPKGKRNYLEKDIDCALREFEEETGIPKTTIKIIENIIPFEEIFIGTNNKSYKHKYFLAYTNSKCNLSNFQSSEVSKIEWKTIDECLTNIRPYNLEKKQLIVNINKILEEYRLY